MARYLGYEKVIGTCSKKKRRYALEVLGYDDVFDSRSVSFAKDIREYTNGRGVDMILNSLTGEGFIDASLSILDI